jgi:hypothetical protein
MMASTACGGTCDKPQKRVAQRADGSCVRAARSRARPEVSGNSLEARPKPDQHWEKAIAGIRGVLGRVRRQFPTAQPCG